MLRDPSQNNGLPINQAARDRDRQRELQRMERAQMLPTDNAEVSPSVQDLFNAPVRVKPSIEDPTSIEIRKTFGSYENARPYLMDTNGSLQRRLIGVDLNTVTSGGANVSGQSSGGDPSHRVQQTGSVSGTVPKPVGPFHGSHPSYSRPSNLPNVIPKVPPLPVTLTNTSVSLSTPSHAIGLISGLSSMTSSIWNVPAPLSPFPQRKQTTLGTTTLPITFVNTTNSNSPATTVAKCETVHCASSGAPTAKSLQHQHTFKKPLERTDSRVDLDSMIREMTDVSSPLSAILPKDSPPKKLTPRRSSKSDERTMEALEGLISLKNTLSPLSTTGMNSSSSSSGSDSSDSDSDSDSSSGSEKTTPSTTPVKISQNTTRSPTERESWSLSSFVGGILKENALKGDGPTSTLETKSAILNNPEPPDSLPESSSENLAKPELNVSSSSGPPKMPNVTPPISETTKALTTKSSPGFVKPTTPIKNSSKESISMAHSRGSPKKVVSESKRKIPLVPSKPVPTILSTKAVATALLTSDLALSGSSSEDDEPPPPPPPKEKDKAKESGSKGGSKNISKRPAPTSTETEEPLNKKARRKSTTPTPPPLLPIPDKSLQKTEEDSSLRNRSKNKSLDRNKNDMIGRLFRPKKEKSEGDGGKEKSSSNGSNGTPQSASPSDSQKPATKTQSQSRLKSPLGSNRVSAKDSSKKIHSSSSTTHASALSSGTSSHASGGSHSSSTPIATNKINGEVKGHSETKSSSSHSTSSKSKRSASPKVSQNSKSKANIGGSSSTTSTAMEKTTDKQDKSTSSSSGSKRSSSPKSGKKGGSSPSSKTKRSSGSPKPKRPSSPSSKVKRPSEPTKPKSTPTEVSGTSTSAAKSTTSKPHLASSSSKSNTTSSSTSSSSKSSNPSKSMPPPPPPGSSHSSSKESAKKEEKGSHGQCPSSLVVRIALKSLPQKSKYSGEAAESPAVVIPGVKKEERKSAREEKHEVSRKSSGQNPSLVGSSVEDLTPSTSLHSKPPRVASGEKSSKDHHHSTSNSTTRKRTRDRSRSSSNKKSKLSEGTELDIKADQEKNESCELSSTVAPYSTSDGSSVAKTPPDPPDSSLNPTHSASPTVTLPQPQYLSYFEKVEHLEDFFAFDQDYYLAEAKRLKHKADKEETGVHQVLTYMDSALYFMLAGISMERSMTKKEAFNMYKETLKLVCYIGSRLRRGEDPLEIKLLVLNVRAQSLLSLQLYRIKIRETMDTSQQLTDLFSRSTYDTMPPPIMQSPHTNLSTPSPHSPALSPATVSSGLIPSSGLTQPAIQSPHHQQPQTYLITKHLYMQLQKHCVWTTNLVSAHSLWEEADLFVERYQLQDFFITIDRLYGPLTLHNSLLDLIRYVRYGLKLLKETLMEGS